MPERFAIAVQWPDDSRPFLVHLAKPYFVAEVRRSGDTLIFVATISTEQLRSFAAQLEELMPAAHKFFSQALGVNASCAHFLKGNHGREFPRYLMAKTASGLTYIVEPDHPAPLVEVREPAKPAVTPNNPLKSRFDTVTQYRLAQMRKYYSQFLDRQRATTPATLVVPQLHS